MELSFRDYLQLAATAVGLVGFAMWVKLSLQRVLRDLVALGTKVHGIENSISNEKVIDTKLDNRIAHMEEWRIAHIEQHKETKQLLNEIKEDIHKIELRLENMK